jgi:hypothetical protein
VRAGLLGWLAVAGEAVEMERGIGMSKKGGVVGSLLAGISLAACGEAPESAPVTQSQIGTNGVLASPSSGRRVEPTAGRRVDSRLPSRIHKTASATLAELADADRRRSGRRVDAPLHERRHLAPRAFTKGLPLAKPEITTRQLNLVPSPAPAVALPGLSDNGSIPPDTGGAVGPTHLIATANGEVRVQNRDGSLESSLSLQGFFSSLGVNDVFDPRTVYDPTSGHFVISAATERASAQSGVALAVSQTSDPTDGWNFYLIDADPADVRWIDFPILGFNNKWVVITGTMGSFDPANPLPVVQHLFACDKASLIAGTASCNLLIQDPFPGFDTPAYTLDASLDTEYLVRVSGGTGEIFIDALTGPVGSEVLTLNVATASFGVIWSDFPPAGNYGPQAGSMIGLELDNGYVDNIVVRDGSIWGVNPAYLPGDAPVRSTVHWFQMSPAGAVEQSGFIDDATGARHFSYATLAVNAAHDVLVGYSRFKADEFVSAGYSFRFGTDPLGEMRGDREYKAGEDTYERLLGDRNRWGDFSATQVDPNDRHLWTIQEYAAADNSWGTYWARVGNDPPDALCRDISREAGPGCAVTIGAADIDAGSFDPDGDTLSCVPSSTGPLTGTASVTLTCTDTPGATDSCIATVTVVDTLAPTFTFVPPDVTTTVCGSINIGQATASDACGVTVTSDRPAVFPPGTTIVTWTARDPAGNTTTATQRITVVLGDNAACCPPGSNVIQGDGNNNLLNGTSGVDCILGRGGQDTIDGLSANDFISAGDGDDVVTGGSGNDVIFGGNGQDRLSGNAGNDQISSGDGDDQCFGGDGADALSGGQGQDRLFGEAGDDVLVGNQGDDRLEGGAGNDTLDGSGLHDVCIGGPDTDVFLICETAVQ